VKGVRGKLKKKCGDIDDGKIETMGAYIVKMKRTCLKMQDVFIFGCPVELVGIREIGRRYRHRKQKTRINRMRQRRKLARVHARARAHTHAVRNMSLTVWTDEKVTFASGAKMVGSGRFSPAQGDATIRTPYDMKGRQTGIARGTPNADGQAWDCHPEGGGRKRKYEQRGGATWERAQPSQQHNQRGKETRRGLALLGVTSSRLPGCATGQ
jgi:hypothetical protein